MRHILSSYRQLPAALTGGFCSLYKNECFRMSPLEEFEEDRERIKQISSITGNCRIFWNRET